MTNKIPAAEEIEIWETPRRHKKHKPKNIFDNIQRNERDDSRRRGELLSRRRDISIQKDPTTTLIQKKRTEEEAREKNTTQYRSRSRVACPLLRTISLFYAVFLF